MPMEYAPVGQVVDASSLDVRVEDGRYLKIACERRKG